MKVVRVLIYEGDESWVKAILLCSLPEGKWKNLTIKTTEHPPEFSPLEYGKDFLLRDRIKEEKK